MSTTPLLKEIKIKMKNFERQETQINFNDDILRQVARVTVANDNLIGQLDAKDAEINMLINFINKKNLEHIEKPKRTKRKGVVDPLIEGETN